MARETRDDQSLEEINDTLYARGATDGLPVVPPTEERVTAMLEGTDRPSDDVIGRLGNSEAALTVERLATNGVMAGCTPAHMPILVAGAEALADPASNTIQFSVSTGSWAYLWIINGPVRNRLDVRCGTGAFGPGFRANRTIGRALGLAYRNTTKIHPGEKDMATVGSPFKYSLVAGENEEESPWEPYHVEEGFDPNDSTITLAGPHSFVSWTPHNNDPKHVLEGMVYHMSPYMIGAELADRTATVFQALSPYNARELAEAGLSKHEVKEYVAENSYLSTNEYSRGKWGEDIIEQVDQGKVPSLQLPQIADPEHLKVFTIGGLGGRYNATIGKSIGGPVTKRIEFPDGWDELVDRYHVEREWVNTSEYYD